MLRLNNLIDCHTQVCVSVDGFNDSGLSVALVYVVCSLLTS